MALVTAQGWQRPRAEPAPQRTVPEGPPPLRLPQQGAHDRLLIEELRRARILPPRKLIATRSAHLRGASAVEDLLASDGADREAMLRHVAQSTGAQFRDAPLTADAGLVDRLGLDTCLARNLAPLARAGGAVVLATGRPSEALRHARLIRARLGPFRLVFAAPATVEGAVLAVRGRRALVRAHENIPDAQGCRGWRRGRNPLALPLALSGGAAALLLAPIAVLVLLTLLTAAMLAANTALKVAAIRHGLRRMHNAPAAPPPLPRDRLPFVSVLVPLLREEDIAGRLVRRLSGLTYPRERLEICLVLERDDTTTRHALERATLPAWMRVVEVPPGPVQTKPRAMNYALSMCRGSIIGIYDAEDAPEADQVERAVAALATAPPELVCVQAALDWYNGRETLLTRLFVLDYAVWFRLMLPMVQRLGLVMPLGGTSLFFRRRALEEIGGWDAWNVTEDADLGLRLARRGWRAEVLPSTTHEEATSHILPWVRQRSRWLKGYALTWATHMRQPRRLWRELGPKRFFWVQVMFLGSVLQVWLAPLLWSFWALMFGLGHPLAPVLGGVGIWTLAGLFLLAEVATLVAAVTALKLTAHQGLARFAPLLHFYGWLATLAAWKAAVELVVAPFYWDKTSHGRRRRRWHERLGSLLRRLAPTRPPAGGA